MRLLSWNVGLTNYFFRKFCMCICLEKKNTCDLIFDVINNQKPDIIFFQELYLDDYRYMRDILRMTYPHYKCNNKIGLAIFSKQEITYNYTKVFRQDCTSKILNTENGILTVYDKENKIYFINLHLSCGLCMEHEFYRLKEAIDMIQLHEKIRDPNKEYKIIIGGDFNVNKKKFKNICDILFVKKQYLNKNNSFSHCLLNEHYDYFISIDKNKREELLSRVIYGYEYISDHLPITTNI